MSTFLRRFTDKGLKTLKGLNADSGHFLGVHNRPGNVNDGSSSIGFLKNVFTQIKETLGHAQASRLPLKSIRTLRFELINRAGHLVRPEGRLTLRIHRDKHTEKLYRKICNALQKAAWFVSH